MKLLATLLLACTCMVYGQTNQQALLLSRPQSAGGGGCTASATDNFTRANGGLGASWTDVQGAPDPALEINGNQVTLVSNGFAQSRLNTPTNCANQFGQITLINTGWTSGNVVEVHVRSTATSTTQSSYAFTLDSTGATSFYKTVTGTDTGLTCTGCSMFTAQAGDIMKLAVVGSSLTATFTRASSIIFTATASDASVTTGQPGIAIFRNGAGTDILLDDFIEADI